jgi:hypothetical protein
MLDLKLLCIHALLVCSEKCLTCVFVINLNRALAKNCNAPVDAKKGGEAKDWKGGKPVRVVRSCKGRKHSEYAPEEGNRYDGLYKVSCFTEVIDSVKYSKLLLLIYS